MSLKHLNGVFAVAKPQGWTSRQVVDHVKYGLLALRATGRGVRSAAKKLSASRVLKIGHGGTLDPLATGVLVIGLGKGTKQLQSYLHGYKTYEVSLVLGSATDTYDSTGKVTARSSTEHVTKRLVLETLQQFRGETWQVPPIKIGDTGILNLLGYELATEDVEFEARQHADDGQNLLTSFREARIPVLINCGRVLSSNGLATEPVNVVQQIDKRMEGRLERAHNATTSYQHTLQSPPQGDAGEVIVRRKKPATSVTHLRTSAYSTSHSPYNYHQTCGPEMIAMDLTECINLTDISLRTIAGVCTKLQGLNLTNCKQITDSSLIQLAKNCRLLRRIKLNGCDKITDQGVIALAENCPVLLEIDLSECSAITNRSIPMMFEKLPQLRELRLLQSANVPSNITDMAFTSLWSDGKRPQFENLRILDLTSCLLLTDDAIECIVKMAPRIRNLILAKCVNISDRGVKAVCALGRHVHYLHFGHCAQITDDGVLALINSCTRLRYLDLACCVQLTDRSIIELGNLTKLKRIGLVKCGKITNESIYRLLDHRHVSHTLERVHLSYCGKLDIDPIKQLINYCTRLTHLSVTGVPAFFRPDLQRFCREPPKDFTPQQRHVFCVFSGKGVRELRTYLNSDEADRAMRAQMDAARRLGLPPGHPMLTNAFHIFHVDHHGLPFAPPVTVLDNAQVEFGNNADPHNVDMDGDGDEGDDGDDDEEIDMDMNDFLQTPEEMDI
ncbi:hypothetical protein BZG36_02841 [Bifiguratus adelaidae]|uniref:Uncharacterized protein n=1 Tax=Bifiguratus adelaidae TaxID=1938954 RepID=A0A261Y0K8_9FUNG|nr:hypothetical protein BZG36_02841 [Bifiguratus adelaidae]